MQPAQPTINPETIGRSELVTIKRIEAERFRNIDAGLVDHRFFLRPCRMKILMLVDNGISFNQFYFGLSEVLDTLRNNPEWWVNFSVTRAHRQTDPNKPAPATAAFALYGPHFENFKFDQTGFNLDDYDQVWIFGFNSGSAGALTPKELEILFRWMDKGGGVFATGDHATLGEALCSQIPRVRNMRKWTTADGVPSQFGPTRHDSLVKGHDRPGTAIDESNQYTFDDESDDIPMRVRPRWYHNHYCGSATWRPQHWLWHHYRWVSPHPILCGRNGVIDVLPDHPHEGEVVVPRVLTDTLTRGTYTAREYPDFNGAPYPPEVIAWARVQPDHKESDFKGVANPKEFGAIGAYNGHCAGVGRVVVDSTWHHWFDVNLTGRMVFGTDDPGGISETGDMRKLNGFNDTPAGQAALAKIRNYFRNVAIWLGRPQKIRCMAQRALWGSIFRFPLHADLNPQMPVYLIGKHAVDVLGNYAGRCNVRQWIHPFIQKIDFVKLLDIKNLLVPVETLPALDEFVLGGILRTMLEAKEKDFPAGKLPDDAALDRMTQAGAIAGLKDMAEHLDAVMKTNTHIAESIKRAIG